jgi:hypothetical protein
MTGIHKEKLVSTSMPRITGIVNDVHSIVHKREVGTVKVAKS